MFSLSKLGQSLVHGKIARGSLEFARHQGFILAHCAAAVIASFGLAAHLIFAGTADVVVLGAIGLLFLPLLAAYYVVRTGKLAAGQMLSSLNLVILTSYVAAFNGGLTSFVIVWLAVTPIEAALSRSRKAIASILAAACLALMVIAALSWFALLPPSRVAGLNPGTLFAFGVACAMIYAGSLAVSNHRYHIASNRALVRSEARYRTVAENATDMITRHAADGRVTFVSGAFAQILDCAPDSLLNDGLEARIHEDDREFYRSALTQAARNGDVVSAEFRIRPQAADEPGAARGHERRVKWVEMRCRPYLRRVPDADHGSEAEIVAITRDISGRKQQQLALRKARDEALSANRAKTRFLANMSHELRTPLNAIIGFSEVLLTETEDGSKLPPQHEYLAMINRGGHDLLNTINGILETSRIETGEMKIRPGPVDLAHLVSTAVAKCRAQADNDAITLNWTPGDQAVTAMVDSDAMCQVLDNILSNALKFTPAGGKVTITLVAKTGFGGIKVSDNGKGIAANLLPKLTEPFIRAENTYDRVTEGTGLGLAIARGLVELHDGRLEIDSRLGAGTQVTVWLPVNGVKLFQPVGKAADPAPVPEHKTLSA
jgi:cell cycle sensor histidine kinase DivJ